MSCCKPPQPTTSQTASSNPLASGDGSPRSKEDVRRDVSAAYARAISAGTGCCGGGPGSGERAISQLAGYAASDEEGLPEGVAESSFGCGNPLAFSDVQPGDTVLDLGSGAGFDLLIAAKKVGPEGKVIGVDMTDEMIARARENVAAAGFDNVELRKGIIEELPVESGSVDWVISNCVVNLSPEKERVFAEIARVLRPGGRMRVSDIVVEQLPDWVRQSVELHSACVAGAVSEGEYLDGLKKAGLADVEVTERLVYEGSQLASMVGDDPAMAEMVATVKQPLDQLFEQIAGKVWSAKFAATKP